MGRGRHGRGVKAARRFRERVQIAQPSWQLDLSFALTRDYKPLTFFGTLGSLSMILGFIPGFVVVVEFIRTGLVTRIPSAVFAVGMVLSGMLSFTVGLVLHTIARRSQEFDFQLRSLFDELNHQTQRTNADRGRWSS